MKLKKLLALLLALALVLTSFSFAVADEVEETITEEAAASAVDEAPEAGLDEEPAEETASVPAVDEGVGRSYTVTLNLDGGTIVLVDGDDFVKNGTSYSAGIKENETVKKPTNDPDKTGHAFVEWQKDGAKYDFSTPITSDFTLDAIFAANTYKVTFMGPLGSEPISGLPTNPVEVAYGEMLTQPDATMEHFTIDGWQYTADGATAPTQYDFTKPYTFESDLTLTAVTTPNTYQVTFLGVDGEDLGKAEALYNHQLDDLRIPQEYMTEKAEDIPAGQRIAWMDGNTEVTFTTPVTGDITVQATYVPQNVEVVFKQGDATLETVKTYKYGDKIEAPNDKVTLQPGEKLLGWTWKPTGATTPKSWDFANDTIAVTGTLTLTAKIGPDSYSVTFFEDAESTQYDVKYAPVDTKKIPELPTKDPTKNGYTFKGWNTKADGTGNAFTADYTVEADMSVYAQWEIVNVTVTIADANNFANTTFADGTPITDGMKTYTVNVEKPLTVQDLKKDGADFKGWSYKDKDNKDAIATFPMTLPDGTFPTGNALTLTAVWDPYYTALFYSEYTSVDDNELFKKDSPIYVVTTTTDDGTTRTLTIADPGTPVKKGYHFDGWFIPGTNEATTFPQVYTNDGIPRDPTHALVWVAHWTKEYTVTFNSNGGTPTYPDVTVLAGESLDKYVKAEDLKPAIEHKVFKYWYQGSIGVDGQSVPAEYDFTAAINSDVDLTAYFVPEQIAVYFGAASLLPADEKANVSYSGAIWKFVDYGSFIPRPTDPKYAKQAEDAKNKVFGGWYWYGSDHVLADEEFDFEGTPVTEEIYTKTEDLEHQVIIYAKWLDPVAKIGDTYYATLQEALAAAENGDTVVLFADDTAKRDILVNVDGAITLKLNAKINMDDSDLVVESGKVTIESDVKAVIFDKGGLFVDGGSVEIKSGKFNNDYEFMAGNAGKLSITGGFYKKDDIDEECLPEGKKLLQTATSQGYYTLASYKTLTLDYNYDGKTKEVPVVDGEETVKPTEPTREGYRFDGWKTTATGDTAFDFGTTLAKDTTIYAKWVKTYKVKFVVDEWTKTLTYDKDAKINVATNIDIEVNAKIAKKDGNVELFERWLDLDGKPVTFPLTVTGDMTLKAQWLVKVTYDLSTGSEKEVRYYKHTEKANNWNPDEYMSPAKNAQPRNTKGYRKNYSFGQWYEEGEDTPFAFETTSLENYDELTLIATWKYTGGNFAVNKYFPEYATTGGSGGLSDNNKQVKYYGTKNDPVVLTKRTVDGVESYWLGFQIIAPADVTEDGDTWKVKLNNQWYYFNNGEGAIFDGYSDDGDHLVLNVFEQITIEDMKKWAADVEAGKGSVNKVYTYSFGKVVDGYVDQDTIKTVQAVFKPRYLTFVTEGVKDPDFVIGYGDNGYQYMFNVVFFDNEPIHFDSEAEFIPEGARIAQYEYGTPIATIARPEDDGEDSQKLNPNYYFMGYKPNGSIYKKFLGWNVTKTTDKNVDYTDQKDVYGKNTLVVRGPLELTAGWEDAYKVTFYSYYPATYEKLSEKVYGKSEKIKDIVKPEDLPDIIDAHNLPSYFFKGWTLNLTTAYDFVANANKNISDNMTFYSYYVPAISVIFKDGEAEIQHDAVERGTKIEDYYRDGNVPVLDDQVDDEGVVIKFFGGWTWKDYYGQGKDFVNYDFNHIVDDVFDRNTVFEAIWVDAVHVNFMNDDGTKYIETQSFLPGTDVEDIGLPETDPSKPSMEFLGWGLGEDPEVVYDFLSGDKIDNDMEFYPVWEESVADGIIFDGALVNFSGEIKLAAQFTLQDVCDADMYKGYSVRFKSDVGTTDVSLAEGTDVGPDNDAYRYYLAMPIPYYSKVVTISLLKDGEPVYFYRKGVAVLSVEYSVQQYAESGTGSEATKALKEALAKYGKAAENMFSKGSWDVGDLSGATFAGIGSSVKDGTLPEGLTYVGTTVNFNSDNALKVVFNVAEGHTIDEYSFKVDGHDAEAVLRGGSDYQLVVPNIAAAELALEHTFVVYDDANTYSLTTSPMIYAKSIANTSNNDKMVALAKALYLYNVAATGKFE